MGLVVNGEDRPCTEVIEPFAKGKHSHTLIYRFEVYNNYMFSHFIVASDYTHYFPDKLKAISSIFKDLATTL